MKKSAQKKSTIIILAICLAIVSVLALFSNQIDIFAESVLLNFNIVSKDDNLLVHFISVGQGDSIAINLPDDKVMLIDTGPYSNSSCLNYLKEKVLNTSNSNRIDYMVLSHADADHTGGALSVLNEFEVGTLFMPVVEGTSQTYLNLVEYVESNNINATTEFEDLVIETAEYEINFFGPVSYSTTNTSCPIIKLTYNNFSFLFTGDVAISTEELFISRYGDLLDCDVLKVGHHGSRTSTSSEFLEVVTPDYAVISCGQNNSYGHPEQETLDRLENVDANILRTDILGDILFVVDNDFGMAEMDGDYKVSAMKFEFVYFAIVVDGVLMFYMILLFIKNNSNSKKSKTKAKK